MTALPPAYMPSLWGPPRLALQQRFEAWLETPNGVAVYCEVRDRALALRHQDIRRYGIAAIFEAARFERTVSLGRDADGFALNNSFRSLLARRLMADCPELAGLFETRVLRS